MNRTEQILEELISIPSVNPRHTPADGGETRIAEYLAQWARSRGWQARMDEVLPGRSNGVVTVPGALPGTILLQTHSDTVEVQGMTVDPFRMQRTAGRVTGRGVCDAKGQLAMFMAAVERVAGSNQPHHTIMLAACVDEEERFRGVLDLCKRLHPDDVLGAVVGEPTELALVTSHKGVLRGRILIDGPGGHSSMPDGVVNPITVAGEVIAYVATQMGARLREVTDPQVGAASLTLTMIDGGDAINIIPRQVAISYDRRTLPGEDPHTVWADLQQDLEGRFQGVRVEEPALADPGLPHSDTALVHAFQSVLSRHDLPAAAVGVPYGSDASKIARLGIPAMVFGAGSIEQAHTPDEYLELDQLHRGVEVMTDLLAADLTRGAA